jgi:uncharacterized lipoprotein YmbA
MMVSLLRLRGCAQPCAAPNRRSVRLTPAAAIVVTKAGTTVVTVDSVRVATPPRVPEVAWHHCGNGAG